jgi:hypothetical protein
MPTQEKYLRQRIGNKRIKIIKTYDKSLGHEAFADMDSAALDHLASSLALEQQYELSDIPIRPAEALDFLWDEVCESAREDGQKCSFFVVTRASRSARSFLYVSGDWPSAENYARGPSLC